MSSAIIASALACTRLNSSSSSLLGGCRLKSASRESSGEVARFEWKVAGDSICSVVGWWY